MQNDGTVIFFSRCFRKEIFCEGQFFEYGVGTVVKCCLAGMYKDFCDVDLGFAPSCNVSIHVY